jgi:glycosyltransferase involved in cell wall biosynthesis
MRLLFLTEERFPTFRPDVMVLFGKCLPAAGVMSDLVAVTAATEGVQNWGGGEAILRTIGSGATRRRVLAAWHGVVSLMRVEPDRYNAIQVRDMPVLAAVAVLVARWKHLPLIYWMSFPMPEGQIALARERGLSAGVMKFLYPWVSGRVGQFLLSHWVLQHATHVFVQSPRMKQDLLARGVATSKMTAVPMGVDLQALYAAQLHATVDTRLRGRRVIGYLGTLDRSRRIETLFEMLAQVRHHVPDAVLLLVGDTDDDVHRSWLRQRAAAAGVAASVVWAGWLPTTQAWSLMLNAEVALSPFPRGELLDSASPTKVPEYLALGLPVVCNDNPDQAAVVRDSGAGLSVPYTAEDFAVAVESLLDLDLETRARMAADGHLYVAAHRDYPRIAAELATVYHRLLG